MNDDALRCAAEAIFQHALKAVDPAEAVRRSVLVEGDHLVVQGKQYDLSQIARVMIVGAGKAGAVMAAAVEELLGERVAGGAVNVKYDHVAELSRVTLQEAGHPVPDENGVSGAVNIRDLVAGLTENDLLVCLISGGGSALLPLPVAGISLGEKQHATQLLLDCGATIHEINTVRKHISQLKGGRLARLAAPARVISLILSDVIGDPLDVIASGPTVADPSCFSDCQQIIGKFGLEEQMPDSVVGYIRSGVSGQVSDTPGPEDRIFADVQNVLIATNIRALTAARAAADNLGFHSMILTSSLEGETREVAGLFPALASEIIASANPLPAPACIIVGGETTVTIRGTGKGGRNQEFVLAAAAGISGMEGVVVFSAGTDGTDGPTDAAGAIADGNTIDRGVNLGMSSESFLSANNSYHYFASLGDLVITGPTGTNVMDLRLLLVGTGQADS